MKPCFEMRRDKHAISAFAALLRFFMPAGPSAFSLVRSAAEIEAARLNLPAAVRQQTFMVGINAGGVTLGPNSVPQGILQGFGFQSFSRSGEIETLFMCEPDSMALTLTDYKSWDVVLPQISQLFGTVGTAYLSETPAIKSFQIQYVNEFRSVNDGFHAVDELFRSNGWLPNFPAGVTEEWHSHNGMFVPIDDDSRYLVNINFDINHGTTPDRPTPSTLAKVTITVSLNFDVLGRQPLILSEAELNGAMLRYFDQAHTLEKKLVRQIFSEAYVEMMGANNG